MSTTNASNDEAARDTDFEQRAIVLGRNAHLLQCRLSLGVATTNVWRINSAAAANLAANLEKTGVNWEQAALAHYAAKHGAKRPPDLDAECVRALFVRSVAAFSMTLLGPSRHVAVANGCCTRDDCPKKLFVLSLLTVMTTNFK
jgi:hypothetical protein